MLNMNKGYSKTLLSIDKQSEIIEAIDKRKPCIITYDNNGHRVVLPHCYYRNVTSNTSYLDCYQIEGYSNTLPNKKHWVTFEVDKIDMVTCLYNHISFDVQSGFNPDSTRYKNKIYQVLSI
jgi:hypothetical protein